MRKTLFVAALTFLLFHSPLARADARDLPPPVAVVADVLSLSEQQTGALIAMIQARDAAIRPLAEHIEGSRKALAGLLGTPTPDPLAVGALLIEIRNAERQVAEVARQAATAFVESLEPEQRQRLQFIGAASQVAPAIPAFKAVGLL